MEPPPSHPGDFGRPARPVPMQRAPSNRERYIDIASSVARRCKQAARCVHVAASALWEALCIVYAFATVLWVDYLRQSLAGLLRATEKYAGAAARFLEPLPAPEHNRGWVAERPRYQTIHRESFAARSPTRPVSEVLVPAGNLSRYEVESIGEESDASSYEIRYQGVTRGNRANVVQDAHAMVLTKRQRGLERITALREGRRRRGLKV